ncbi:MULTISPECIES: alpha/beta fold hydrolase [Streptomyces]|jgi:pimeloyl-ACP methyl ester carboxylesterase|uniref:alpha/beta fold hydrolase n=1 Tax=Streptomyces TaxID=1883 RepID=UPI000A39D59D|nr:MULTISPECIES: alpha/beta fold hydrolase [Streptomyces]MCX5203572.1 alpha/beta fold hydrolase [Streptomyces sp. NBC_00237]CAD5932983.1 AB hydrolase-1 domain-containing protein [Streptomyces sp. KY70]CAD5988335.1 AB hydrolase-1 domain-containing protein [Streptomyces sp. KY75]
MTDTNTLRKGYVPSRFGQLHYVETGDGEPVLLLHQTPRSWTEYLDVLPLVGARYRAIAMDTLGYGASAKPEGQHTIERFADGVGDLIEALGLHHFHLVGHHTGGVVAVEVAARFQDRVASLLLSATSFVDDEKRGSRGRVDHVDPAPDGTHLRQLWDNRRGFYQPGEEAALGRYVIDALTVLDRVEEGHQAVRRYAMEPRLPKITARTLAVCAPDDGYSMPSLAKFAAAIGCPTRVLSAGHAAAPEQVPQEFAATVLEWAGRG